ncbi:hypothetical protein [Myceligenerans crystallogenes]|uniref:DUF308 domain-containing protein n=1 Tax=Myceligenerans crystallogenes TaxID=316335 RepID=A0ABN2NEY8_9MICO
MAASNTDDRDDDLPEEPAPPADRSEDAARDTTPRPGEAAARSGEPAARPGELPDEAVDARFADLIASLGDLGATPSPAPRTPFPEPSDLHEGLRPAGPAGTVPPDGAREDDATTRGTPGLADDAATAPQGSVPRPAGPRDWPVTPEVEALEEAEGHFSPPEPEPLLTDKDPLATMAWFAVGGIPILALISVILVAAVPSLQIPPLVGQVALGLFALGLGVLLWRMPHRRDPEDNDPGAVV